jgi:hypothetical protein
MVYLIKQTFGYIDLVRHSYQATRNAISELKMKFEMIFFANNIKNQV